MCQLKWYTLNYSEEFKREAIQIFYEGNSGRTVGRLMKINKSTVCNWIKALNKKIENPKPKSADKISKEDMETDELYSYTTHKKQNLFNHFCNKKAKTDVGFDIALDKNENRIQNIADNSPKAKLYFSDANPSYQNVS